MKDLKDWLGTGSINIFGKPFAGKDTVGKKLAQLLDAPLIGGGDILRNDQAHADIQAQVEDGSLAPTKEFQEIIVPYLSKPSFDGKPLILSSVGRWHGEESTIVSATNQSNHPLKAVVYIDIDEDEVHKRWQAARQLGDRGQRKDDAEGKLEKRLDEFNSKTVPVLDFYRQRGLLIEVNGMNSREQVMQEVIDKLQGLAKS